MKRYVLKAAVVSASLFVSVPTFAGQEVDKSVRGIAKMDKISDNNYFLSCSTTSGFCYRTYTNGNMDIYLGSRILRCRPAFQSPPPQLVPDLNDPSAYNLLNSIIVVMDPGQQVPSMP